MAQRLTQGGDQSAASSRRLHRPPLWPGQQIEDCPLRPFLSLFLIRRAAPAHAHVGHLGEVAGHDHWVAGIAIGAAVAVGLWGVLKGGRAAPKDEPATEGDAKHDSDEAAA